MLVPQVVDQLKTQSLTNNLPEEIDPRTLVRGPSFSVGSKSAKPQVRFCLQKATLSYFQVVGQGKSGQPRQNFAGEIGIALGKAVPGKGENFQELWNQAVLDATARYAD